MDFKKIYDSNKERVLTGLVLMGIAILMAIMDSLFLTWAILGICYMFAFYEAMKLFGEKDNKFYVYALLIWIAAAFYPHPIELIFIVLVVLIATMAHKKDVKYEALAPFLYPSISMLFLLTLYKDFGMSILIWLVVVVASTDTGAYFVGKSIGKTPFSPTSPNKTWEGVVGGIFIATIAGTFIGMVFYPVEIALVTSLLVSASSVWGDLFESYLKREAGVKDSGTIFPGHGGFLDRLDGYLFAVIFMFVILRGLS
ncbi:phosphatidate cytidylyltransferase [Sulfurospirillum arcachonense]|uniref:phosphatidate cytidylyltransferase n=1 Tax=Sulfurospirillum arcachonense TaxID=57666 RepID=UPI000468B1A0|nr:phosphatidate cytidylyltransferase [Sulfurospirillum arcachonense]